MGIKEKLAHVKKTDWIREGFTDEEVREIVESAKNEAKNFRKELEAKNSEKNVKEENQVYFFKKIAVADKKTKDKITGISIVRKKQAPENLDDIP